MKAVVRLVKIEKLETVARPEKTRRLEAAEKPEKREKSIPRTISALMSKFPIKPPK